MEEALREKIPSVTLPYWDSSMDYDMDDPTQSLMWSHDFVGNGDGHVTTGPFANWPAPDGSNADKFEYLQRNVGQTGMLFNKRNISSVLSRRHTADITLPASGNHSEFVLEYYHDDAHRWVGGNMAHVPIAAYDPLFFLLHANVDYIWEQFRILQQADDIDPSKNYPDDVGLPLSHVPFRAMDAFPWFRNMDGYSNFWTESLYSYEPAPSCSSWKPHCGSLCLTCDVSRYRCLSKKDAWKMHTAKRPRFSQLHGPRFQGRHRSSYKTETPCISNIRTTEKLTENARHTLE